MRELNVRFLLDETAILLVFFYCLGGYHHLLLGGKRYQNINYMLNIKISY